MSNYVQPDFRNPSTPGVTVQPHQAGAATGNPLAITTIAKYTQPGNPPGRAADPTKISPRNPLGM